MGVSNTGKEWRAGWRQREKTGESSNTCANEDHYDHVA